MCSVAVSIPEEVLFDTKMSKKDVDRFVKRSVAMCYYVQNHVSIGYCAKIADMTEEDFIKYLGDNYISAFCFEDKEEFLEDLKNA